MVICILAIKIKPIQVNYNLMSPPNRQQQLDEVLDYIYDEFLTPQPHGFYLSAGHAIEVIETALNADSNEAADVWELFKDQYVYPRPTKNSDLISAEGIERLHEIRDDIPYNEKLQEEIVEFLHEYYLDNPRGAVERDQILEEFDASDEAIDLNIYVLKVRNWVETNTQMGIGDEGYSSVELAEAGRKQLSG